MKKKYIKTSINSGDCLRVSKMLSKNTGQQMTFITPLNLKKYILNVPKFPMIHTVHLINLCSTFLNPDLPGQRYWALSWKAQ